MQNLLTGREAGLRESPNARIARADGAARRYLRDTLGLTLGLYALLALALAGVVPVIVLIVAVPLCYVRLSLAMHELLHILPASRVPAFHRLAMIFDTPFGLGFREHRAMHLRHHRCGASEADPELYQIAGGHLRAVANALIAPERACYFWIRERGLRGNLLREGGFRLAAFGVVAAVNPVVFVAYWISLRLSIAAAGFVFHHVLHNRSGELGTFALPVSPSIERIGRAVFGEEPMLILTRHRSHHLWPALRVRELPALPRSFSLPAGRLTPDIVAEAVDAAAGGARG